MLYVFLIFVVLAAYPVVLYPALVRLLARIRPRRWRVSRITDPVVHIIAVFNEERRIRAKLENSLSVNPPAGGVRIVVTDDGSSDRTEEIVAEYADRGVVWIGSPRRGKECAQIQAVRGTSESILVFSDASTSLMPDAIEQIVRPFVDSRIGAVSGTDRLEGGASGEDLYVDYEMGLRRAESLAGSLVGLSGCFFALRRDVAERLFPDVPSDLAGALLSIASGRRAVAQDRAVCTYGAAARVEREFARKRRTALRGLRGLWAYRRALTLRQPVASWQLLSHKWLRFLVPWFVFAALFTAGVAALRGAVWAAPLLALCTVGLGAGLLAVRFAVFRRARWLRALAFLILANLAVLAAWIDLVSGRTRVTWVPTSRP